MERRTGENVHPNVLLSREVVDPRSSEGKEDNASKEAPICHLSHRLLAKIAFCTSLSSDLETSSNNIRPRAFHDASVKKRVQHMI